MFTSFDEKVFRQAIKDKDYLRLKVNTASSILNDPTFEREEITEVLKILREEVPEIFEEYVELDYEEHPERSAWDKRYFTKLTYWFQKNFAEERLEHMKEVGRVVHEDTAREYAESMALKKRLEAARHSQAKDVQPQKKQAKKHTKTTPEVSQDSPVTHSSTSERKPQEKKAETENFPMTGAILAVVALVIVGILLFKFLVK